MRKKYLGALAGLVVGVVGGIMPNNYNVDAASCPDVRIVFARGSGGTRWEDANYLSWRDALDAKLKLTSLSYEFVDLDYPAVGIDNLSVLIGAGIGAGESYEFGESVNAGVSALTAMVNGSSCATTKYVIGGYSQGAMVVSKALRGLKADRVIYAATFGDPKIYLPEGKGLFPAACRGENLSDYRIYVPDCHVYEGLLGSYQPYEPADLLGKVGTWCNKRDIFCSTYWSISNHVSYVDDDLYEDASKLIFSKITSAFNVKNSYVSAHDTAIVIDSTGSMGSMIERYKSEALRLARETFGAGGRVALYDYRDLFDPYSPVEHCNFETCTMEIFEKELGRIICDGGGDTNESLLSASFNVMKTLKWKRGATKSLVVLTDAGFLNPDRDGISYSEVVRLSKEIDPVNFYIITEDYYADAYAGLAKDTGGKVVTIGEDLSLLTDEIMERFDSLPVVEEDSGDVVLPSVEMLDVARGSDGKVTVRFSSDGEYVLVALNDLVMGMVEARDGAVTIDGLDFGVENELVLVPVGNERRGESVKVVLNESETIPKAPDTGRQ